MSNVHRILPLVASLSLTACSYSEHSAATDAPYGDWGSTAGTSPVAIAPEAEPPPDEPPPTDPACDLETPVTLFASPDDSNSMSSPVQAREAVLAGWSSLSAVPVRTWEFLNYATWDYTPAAPGEIAVDLQLAETGEPGGYALQVGLSSEWIAPEERDPMNLTFALDQSCSMSGEPLDLAKETMRAIAGGLRAGDVVSLVLWSDRNAVLLDGHAVSGPSDPDLLREVNRLSTGGSTNLSSGLREAYRLAEKHRTPGRINRVLLLSDGGANTGRTDEELIGEKAGANDEDGIYLIGVGTGTAGTYNDLLMDRVTDLGRGASIFVPSEDEAWRMFGGRFLEALSTTARDVRIRYDLPPGFEVTRFSGEEISTNPDEVQPQHLSPNDAVVLHQHLRTCAAEVSPDATIGVTVSYLDGITYEPREISVTRTIGELLGGEHRQLLKGAAVFAYAEALKAERGDPSMFGIPEARDALLAAEAANPGDADLAEIRAVLEAL